MISPPGPGEHAPDNSKSATVAPKRSCRFSDRRLSDLLLLNQAAPHLFPPFDARAHPGSGPVRLTAAPERPAPSKLLSAAADQQTSPSPPSPAPSPGRFKALSAAAEPERLGDRRSRYGREAAPAPQHPRTRRARHRAAHAAPRTQRFACAFSGTHLRTRCLRLLVTEEPCFWMLLDASAAPRQLSPLSRRVHSWLPATSWPCRASAALSASASSSGRRSSP